MTAAPGAQPTPPPKSYRSGSLSPNIVALPSKNQGGSTHVLTVIQGRVVCVTCPAGLHDKQCYRAKSLQSKLEKVNKETLHELVTIKERVWNLLYRFPDARESDLALFRHYFEEYHGLEPGASWLELLALIGTHYHGNSLETIRRRRQEYTAPGGPFEASSETE